MTNPEIIDAVAVPIDTDVTQLGAFESWLAACSERVDATAAKFEPAPIETEEQFKAAKKCRTEVRRERNAIDAERKGKLKAVEDALRELKAQVKDVLVPLDALDAQYRSLMDDYERRCHDRRAAALRAEYDDYELADLVPYDRFAKKFDPECRWLMRSVTDAKASELMHAAMRATAADWQTIEAFQATDNDRADLRADYIETLDLADAVRRLQARIKQREAAAAWEREQVELAQRAANAPVEPSEPREAPITPEPVPESSQTVTEPPSAPETFRAPKPAKTGRKVYPPTHAVVVKCSEREAALIDAYARNEIGVFKSRVFEIPDGGMKFAISKEV